MAKKSGITLTANEGSVGTVTHYYAHLGVAVVRLNMGALRTGDIIHVKGHSTDFTQTVESMESDHRHIEEAAVGQSVGLKVADHVQENDIIYLVKSEKKKIPTVVRKKDNYSADDLKDAQFLIEAARIHAMGLHESLLKIYPELINVAKSGLIDFWELIITVASVGLAFSEIIDTVPPKKQESLSYAIQKALDDYHEIAYRAMVDFLNHFKKGMDSGIEIPLALGSWIWANLAKDEKANSKLKKLLYSKKIPLSIGYPTLEAFHSWWLK